MDKAFLNKVQQIILKHLEDENLNVETLAFEIGLSRSQLLRKVKGISGKSVNQFIREIRLQEAAKLIQKDEFTASEIAYKVGFSSPSYFNKCFHDYFDVTPGDYGEQSEEEIKKIIAKANSADSIFFKKPKVLFSVILFLIALLLTGFFMNRNSVRKNKLQNSIAVLYFDDMSSEQDSQWFCDGITDEIYTNLSKLKNLKVISRTSVKRYKNSDKSIPKIAKELDVSYILEGSVKKDGEMFRITVKLINSYDETVWSQEYDEKIEYVLKTQRKVSNEIVNRLHIVVSPEEEKRLRKIPTDNLEAYKYYIKARNLAEKSTKEYFDLSIDHYQKAIDLDPNFANAYAEMAQTYLYNRWKDQTNWDQNKIKAGLLVEQALKIDPNCAKAYAARAKLNMHYNKQEEIKHNFERAIKLNPNDPLIHRDMAFYYTRSPARDKNKSLYHINKAIELDPISSVIKKRKIYVLLSFGRLSEAEAFNKNVSTLFTEEDKIDIENYTRKTKAVITGIEKKDMMESINFLQKEMQKDPQNPDIYSFLGEIYNGVLNDNFNYIKYVKKAYIMDSLLWEYALDYSLAMVEGKKFKEAEKLMNSKNFKGLMSDSQQLDILSRYYYYMEDYDAAMKCVNDPLLQMNYYYYMKILILAQKGDVKGVREILNNTYVNDYHKAKVFAILKERDSMYYYIDKMDLNNSKMDSIKSNWLIRNTNASKEFDPYRKEERYKEFLKKNYYPITHWNE